MLSLHDGQYRVTISLVCASPLVLIGMRCFIGERRAAVYLRQEVDFSKVVKLKSQCGATRQKLTCLVWRFWSSQSHEILARSISYNTS